MNALVILAAAGALFLIIQMVMGIMAIGALSAGLVSCVRSCSDDPIGDSPEVASFIADRTASERDLATFDALRGCLDSLYRDRESDATFYDDSIDGVTQEHLMSVDELRAAVAAGIWPEDPAGYGGTDGSLDPQTWVRLAELAQDWLEDQTGERWEVVDFAYPFPNNGPIPVPATRGEGSSVTTRLHCTSGEDTGLYVDVSYYRWRRPTTFESNLDALRAQLDERAGVLRQVQESDLLAGRRFLVDGSELFLWSTGDDDELRDPDAFVAFANEAMTRLPINSVSLVAKDAPVMVDYDSASFDYPSSRPRSIMSLEDAQQAFLRAGNVCSFDYARLDLLLRGSSWQGQEIGVDDLYGELSPKMLESTDHYDNPWPAVWDRMVYDEGLTQVVAGALGCDTTDVMTLRTFDVSSSGDETTTYFVFVREGTVPETHAFCAVANDLRDLLWDYVDQSCEEGRVTMYLALYVVGDEGLVDASGGARGFADLREAVVRDPASVMGWSCQVRLHGDSSYVLWGAGEEPHRHDCEVWEVGGTVARSREWRYEE